MATRNRQVGCIVGFVLLACIPLAAQAQDASHRSPAQAQQHGIYVTSMEKKKLRGAPPSNHEAERWVPRNEKLAFAWSDQLFAVHIPFEIPQADGLSYEICVTTSGFKQPGSSYGEAPPLSASNSGCGFYRLDDRPVFNKDETSVAITANDSSTSVWREGAGVVCSWPRYWLAWGPATPLNARIKVARSPAPGRAVFWFAPSIVWNGTEFDGEQIEAEVRIEFKNAVANQKGQVIKVALPPAQSFPLVIRQNGWVPRPDTKVTYSENWKSSVVRTSDLEPEKVILDAKVEDVETKCDGKQLISKTRIVDASPRKHAPVERTREFTLPPVIWDWTPVSVRLKSTRTDSQILKLINTITSSVQLERGQPDDLTLPGLERSDFQAANDGTFVSKIRLLQRARDTAELIRPSADAPILSVEMDDHGWRKKISISFTRLSSTISNLEGAVRKDAPLTAQVMPDDGYWEWLRKFNEMRDRNQNRVDATRIALEALAKTRRELRAKFLKLMYIDMKSHPSAEDDDLLNRTRFQSTFTQAALEELRQTREQLRVEMLAIDQRQEAMIQQALRPMKELKDSAEAQQIASKERRPKLKGTIQECEDKYALTKLELYDKAELYDELPKVVEEFQFASTAVREVALLMSAKVALARANKLDQQLWVLVISPKPVEPNSQVERDARAARIQAVSTLYEVLKLNSNNAEARRMLREQELKFIGWIAAKLDREKKFSLAGFHRYLKVRGYSTEPHKDWWDGFIEVFHTYLGSGPTTLTAGLPGWTADVMADIAEMDQENIAKNQMSLFGIRRLMRTGMTLREIRHISTDEMLKRLEFQTIERRPVGKGRARRLAQDIHETFAELYDLRTLAEGNQQAFETFFARNYYQSIDPERTWAEAIGDFFSSPIGILGWFGPSAICKVDGQWALLSPGNTRLLEEAGRIQRARDLFATTLRLEEAGTLMGQYVPGFRGLQQLVVADQAFLNNLSGLSRFLTPGSRTAEATIALERFLNSGSRLAAVVVVYGAADHLAEEARSPILKVLVEALGILGTEEMTYDILERAGIRTKLLARLDELKGLIGGQRAELAEAAQAIQRLEGLGQRLSASGADASHLNDVDISQIDDILRRSPSAPPLQSPPGSHRPDDLHSAVHAAGEALKAGDVGEAKRSLRFAKDSVEEMAKTLDALDLKWQQAHSLLSKQPSLRQVDLTQIPFLTGLQKPESFIPPPGGYPSGEHGKFMEMGDEALRRGELEKAEDLYRAALGEAKKSGIQDPKNLIDYRLALVAHARDAMDVTKKLRSLSSPAPVDEPISDVEIIRRIEAKELILERLPGSLNPVYLLKDQSGKIQYVFKNLSGTKEIEIGPERFCAAVTNKLQKALGLKAPVCQRVSLPPNPELPPGARGAQGLLSRFIPGQPLKEVEEPALLALKDDYARQRVLRLWLCDTDGHLGNLRLGTDGRLSPIDFGMAHLNSKFEQHKQFDPETVLGRKPNDQADLMRACLMFNEKIPKLFPTHQSVPLYAWLDRIDGMLNYDDMKGAVDAIKALCNDRQGQTLKDILQETLPAGQVNEAFQALIDRANWLEKVLTEKYPRYLRTSLLPFPKSRRLPQRLPPWQGLPAALEVAA